MKIGDQVYVHGYVDEIRGNTVIIKNKGGYFGTCKKEVSPGIDWAQLVYPIDKFSVVVYDDKIHVVSKDEWDIKVTTEPKTDCAWK